MALVVSPQSLVMTARRYDQALPLPLVDDTTRHDTTVHEEMSIVSQTWTAATVSGVCVLTVGPRQVEMCGLV
jgi:hypothetical protein